MAKINVVMGLKDNISSPLDRIAASMNGVSKSMSSFSSKVVAANQLIQLVGTVVSKVGNIFSVPIKKAGEYEMYLSQLTTAMGGNAKKAQEEFKRLQDFAATTPFDMPGVVQASIMFRNVGMEAEKILPMIRMLGDVTQGDNDKFNRMAINLMQVKSMGKAMGQDLNQFAMAGIPIKSMLQEMGVTGQATYADIERALIRMTSAGGQFYNSMALGSETMMGKNSNLGDSFEQLMASIGDIFTPVVKSGMEALSSMMTVLKEVVDNLHTRIDNFVEGVVKNFEVFKKSVVENISTIVIVFGLVTTAITILGIRWVVTHASMLASTISTAVTTAAIWIKNIAKIVAQHAIQMARMAVQWFVGLGPAGWIIAGVIALIAAAIAIAIKLGVTFEDVGRTIGGAFGAVKAVVNNVFVGIWNTIASLWGKIKEFIEWLGIDLGGTADMHLKEYLDVGEEIEKGKVGGAEKGRAVDEWLQSLFKKTPSDFLPELKTDSQGNLLVKDSSVIDVAKEFQGLLSKLAFEKMKVNLANITPQVSFGGVTVNNNADVDDILAQLADGVANMAESRLY